MKRFFLPILILLGLVSVLPVVYVVLQSRPVTVDGVARDFSVNQGDGVISISRRLEKNQIIRSRYSFIFYAYLSQLNNRLQYGIFRLSPANSTSEVVTMLSSGGSNDYWFKIIDGQRIEEITRNYPQFIFSSTLEGYLFPDSYLIPRSYDQTQVEGIVRENFEKQLTAAKQSATSSLSDTQALVLASLIEREARTLPAKQMVSGILHNRLRIGMALQVDATVQFVRDSRLRPQVYWTPASKSDLAIKSPYNTYQGVGLPPGPICNPGYNSLFAAFHPVSSDFLYYITGKDNQMHYATTLEEHNQNIAKYLR